jgi:hypothetical protein
LDVDLFLADVNLEWDKCPWNEDDGGCHKCATKDAPNCKYFQGTRSSLNVILCNYGKEWVGLWGWS